MMGCGKTTIGQRLAQLLAWPWYDTDAVIEAEYGAISDIFARHGESYFREIETQTLASLSALDEVILSVGGGLVLRKENVDILRGNAKIVFLDADISTLEKRLQDDVNRPLLKSEEGLHMRLASLLKERLPIYQSVADYVVKVDNKTVDEVAKEVLLLAVKQ